MMRVADQDARVGAVRPEGGISWPAVATHLLFPDCCPICGAPCKMTDRPWCAGCARGVRLIRRCICPQCRRYRVQDFAACPEEHEPSRPLYVVALGAYDDALGSAVGALKYIGSRVLARPLASQLADCVAKPVVFDTVVAVPTGREKRRRNGFGHAEVIGAAVAEFLGVAFAAQGLVQTRRLRDQTRLTAEERRRNLSGAFVCPEPDDFTGRNVLVVDDVMTTGATLEEAARALTEAGTGHVAGAVVALNLGGRPAVGRER